MNPVFYVVEGMRFGQGMIFFFDSEKVANEFADFAGCSVRKYRPRSRRTIHVAYSNTLGTKGWLKQNGIDLWPEDIMPDDFLEFCDTDDNLPF